MKQIKKHHAQWALGASATLASLGSAQAAVVRVDLNHDLTMTLDGVDFGSGLGTDNGQWLAGSRLRSSTVFRFLTASRGSKTDFNVASDRRGRVGSGGLPGGVLYDVAAVRPVLSGLIAWNLADGTEGWLHVTSSNAINSELVADYFAFDDELVGMPGGRTAGNLVHNNDAEAFANAPLYTGAQVPEPSSLALLVLGAAGVVSRRRRAAA